MGPPQSAYPTRFHEELDTASQHGSVVAGPSKAGVQRSDSQVSAYSRTGISRKESSLGRKSSLRRSASRRSLRAGSVRSLHLGDREKYVADNFNSAFYVPIPTHGNPTEVLAERFQAWRKILKDLIIFFKDLQKSYETRSKLLLSASNIINNTAIPPTFLQNGGIADATEILREFHRQGLAEANKAKDVESEVVAQLTGLRSDLHKKTKEIKSLAGDFKNSVDKEIEGTRKTVRNLQEALGLIDLDHSAASGKGDPFIIRLAVDRQVEKQIEEENYLHRAFLNLESSGRELEAIVVGEIQKAYDAYANILKREADVAYDTVEKLRAGPLSMPKDHEWNSFLAETDELVDPAIPLRDFENITYPGKDHPATVEVRSGMLERKSKYLKSYTPGWYVLSPTHLHEFKSTDRADWQAPVMSLYLPDQKLGSHSQPDSTSHKFMLKGRQTGTMHRGHSWVFRAESHETMMAWYEDIENLMARSGETRNAFVRRHFRSASGTSAKSTASNDPVMEEDEADRTPYSANTAILPHDPPAAEGRPQPGGRFPSDIQVDRHLNQTLLPSSGESSADRDLAAVVDPLLDRHLHTASDRTDIEGQTGRSPSRRPDSYYDDSIGETAIYSRQQQQDATSTTQPDAHEGSHAEGSIPSNPPSIIAQTSEHHPSQLVASRATRRGSASTVPTTNNTENTNHTMPTSVDEDHELMAAPVSLKRTGSQQTASSGRGQTPFTGEDHPVTPAGRAQKDGETSLADEESQPSMAARKDTPSTLELRIPGHYPPNVPA